VAERAARSTVETPDCGAAPVAPAVAAGVAGAVAGVTDRAVVVCTGAGAGSETREGEAQPASSASAASSASSERWVVNGIVMVVFL
jgi:hypothetical protein